jgi:hypothetical protein
VIDESQKPPALRDERGDEALVYDFFKHMTSLSLITLGGVLTLSQSKDQEIDRVPLLMILAFVATSGISAFMGVDEIVKARVAGTGIPKRVEFLRKISPMAFALGVGAFLYAFVNTLD